MEQKKNPVAQALVAMRNKKLTPEQRSAIALKAAQTRWKKQKATSKGGKAGGKK
jgi:hypothetical protein